MRRIFYLPVVVVVAFYMSGLYVGSDEADKVYKVSLGESNVYDGDTIQDVWINVKGVRNKEVEKELWPGLYQKNGAIYIVTDIRIAGIDTPEKRPYHAGRTEESLLREKAAAALAQQALYNMIAENDFKFEVRNPELGKYAGRIVAEVWVGGISAAEYLIEQGHAIEYQGGTKLEFDDWYGR